LADIDGPVAEGDESKVARRDRCDGSTRKSRGGVAGVLRTRDPGRFWS